MGGAVVLSVAEPSRGGGPTTRAGHARAAVGGGEERRHRPHVTGSGGGGVVQHQRLADRGCRPPPSLCVGAGALEAKYSCQ